MLIVSPEFPCIWFLLILCLDKQFQRLIGDVHILFSCNIEYSSKRTKSHIWWKYFIVTVVLFYDQEFHLLYTCYVIKIYNYIKILLVSVSSSVSFTVDLGGFSAGIFRFISKNPSTFSFSLKVWKLFWKKILHHTQ